MGSDAVDAGRGVGLLAERLIEEFHDFPSMFAERDLQFDGRVPSNTWNRNLISGVVVDADGLKTGHTKEAGYYFVGSTVRDGAWALDPSGEDIGEVENGTLGQQERVIAPGIHGAKPSKGRAMQ